MSSRLEVDNLTASCFIQDDNDMSKRIKFNVSNVTGDKVITFNDANIVVVGESNVATLTNKTIDANDNTLLHIKNASIDTLAGIDATKIADGTVTNTTFQYVSGATSNIQSQITNHVDDYTNPHHVTKAQVGLGNVQNILDNLTATTAPTASNDNTENYVVGSTWINTTTGQIFVATSVATGNAVWKSTVDTDNTVSNVGVAGTGLYKQKVGLEFEFKNVNAGSNKISITDDTINNTVDVDLVPSNVDILSLLHAPTSTVVGISDTQTLTNKTINASNNTITNITNTNIASNASIDATKIADGTVTNTVFEYLKNVTSDIQGQFNSVSTGKVDSASNVGVGGVGVFKQKTGTNLEFKNVVAGSTKVAITDDTANSDVKVDVVPSNIDILSLLNAPTSTVVGISDTQTLTNKVLTNAKINTALLDINNNALINVTATASAVNAITVANNATGLAPSISAVGTDTNINLNLAPKGTGNVVLSNIAYPNADGVNGQVMVTDGNKHLSFQYVPILSVQTITTTNATPTVGATIATANNTVYLVEADIVAIRSDTGFEATECAGYKLIYTVKNVGGTVTVVAKVKDIMEDLACVLCDSYVSVSGTNIVIDVVGITSKTFKWKISSKVTNMSA